MEAAPLSINDFLIQRRLGRGSTGETFLAKSANCKISPLVVIKRISKVNKCFKRTRIIKEIEIGEILKHDNVANCLGFFEDSDYCYLLFEYVNGMDLVEFMKNREFQPLEEQEARTIFRQLMNAISYI